MKKWFEKIWTDEFRVEFKDILISFLVTSALLGSAVASLVVAILAGHVGEHRLAEVLYIASLVLGLIGGLYSVPRLAKRVRWDFLPFNISYSFTQGTAFFLVLAFIIGIAALNTGNNLLYLIFSLFVGFMLTSGVVSEICLRELDVGLRFPDHVHAGQEMYLDITVTNHKVLLPSFSLAVGVELANEGDPSFRARMRKILLGPKYDGVLSNLAYFVVVPSRQRLRQTIPFTFAKRGRYEIKGFTVGTTFPFGFVRKTRHIEAQGELVVYPEIEKRRDLLNGLNDLMGTLENFLKGNGADLYVIRQYQNGDNLRHIDWKATAKSRRTMVKEFTREDDRKVTIFLDPSRPSDPAPDFAEQFERAIKRAATIACRLIETNTQVRLVTPTDDTDFGDSIQHLHAILRVLALVNPTEEGDDDSAEASEFNKLLSGSNQAGLLFTARPARDDRLNRFQRYGKIIPYSMFAASGEHSAKAAEPIQRSASR